MEKQKSRVYFTEKIVIKKILKTAAVLAVMAVTAAAATYFIFEYYNTPAENSRTGEEAVFSIKSGDNVSIIAENLEKAGLIRSAEALKAYSRILGTGGSFKTGSYRIRIGENMSAIHNILIRGHQILYKITIPEGWSIKRIGALLEKEGITNASDFYKTCSDKDFLLKYGIKSDSAEGFLFPDTYMFQKDFPAEKAAGFMIENFYKNLSIIYSDYKKMDFKELYRKIILASIVEREYRLPEEAPLIAGVFYNRLEEGISLGSCATIAYIITDIEGKNHPSRITYDDLEIKSPYNTYINKGLPPGPISNPGKTALKAVFFPAETDYMYFVLEDPSEGKHKFTTSYKDHLLAKNLYIKSK